MKCANLWTLDGGPLLFYSPVREVPPPLRIAPCERRRFPAGSVLRRSTSNLQRSEEHTSELQSRFDLVCRLLLEKKNVRATSHTLPSRQTRKPAFAIRLCCQLMAICGP